MRQLRTSVIVAPSACARPAVDPRPCGVCCDAGSSDPHSCQPTRAECKASVRACACARVCVRACVRVRAPLRTHLCACVHACARACVRAYAHARAFGFLPRTHRRTRRSRGLPCRRTCSSALVAASAPLKLGRAAAHARTHTRARDGAGGRVSAVCPSRLPACRDRWARMRSEAKARVARTRGREGGVRAGGRAEAMIATPGTTRVLTRVPHGPALGVGAGVALGVGQRARVRQLCLFEPGRASTARDRSVPVQMWATASPVAVQMWQG
jgi:hypothetical protein